jgi:hypothetical protein
MSSRSIKKNVFGQRTSAQNYNNFFVRKDRALRRLNASSIPVNSVTFMDEQGNREPIPEKKVSWNKVHVEAIEKALRKREGVVIRGEHPTSRRAQLLKLLKKVDYQSASDDLNEEMEALRARKNLRASDEGQVLNYLQRAGIASSIKKLNKPVRVNDLLEARQNVPEFLERVQEFGENSRRIGEIDVNVTDRVGRIMRMVNSTDAATVNVTAKLGQVRELLNTILVKSKQSRQLKRFIFFIGFGSGEGENVVEWILSARNLKLLMRYFKFMLMKTDQSVERGWGEMVATHINQVGSDIEIVERIIEEGVMAIDSNLTVNGKKGIRVTLRWQLRQNTSREVGFFPYTFKLEDFPFSLARLQIFKKSELDADTYKENCVVNALRDQKVPEEKLSFLKNMRLDVGKRYIRTSDLKWIADTLNIQINVKYVRNDEQKNRQSVFNPICGDPEQSVHVGVIDKHMFSNYRMEDLTLFAFRNFGEIKKQHEKLPVKWSLATRRTKDRKGAMRFVAEN